MVCWSCVFCLGLKDILLVDKSYNEGNFAHNYNDQDVHWGMAASEVNDQIQEIAGQIGVNIKRCNIACTECFDPYIENPDRVYESFPKELDIAGSEMEAFSLLYTAKRLGKKAACMLTVVDAIKQKKGLTSEERRASLLNMIKVALKSLI